MVMLRVYFSSLHKWIDLPDDVVALAIIRVTNCLEMSGNLTAVREMSGILHKIREMSGKKSCWGKVAYLCPYRYLVGVYSVLNIKYMVLDMYCYIPTRTTDSNTSTGMI